MDRYTSLLNCQYKLKDEFVNWLHDLYCTLAQQGDRKWVNDDVLSLFSVIKDMNRDRVSKSITTWEKKSKGLFLVSTHELALSLIYYIFNENQPVLHGHNLVTVMEKSHQSKNPNAFPILLYYVWSNRIKSFISAHEDIKCELKKQEALSGLQDDQSEEGEQEDGTDEGPEETIPDKVDANPPEPEVDSESDSNDDGSQHNDTLVEPASKDPITDDSKFCINYVANVPRNLKERVNGVLSDLSLTSLPDQEIKGVKSYTFNFLHSVPPPEIFSAMMDKTYVDNFLRAHMSPSSCSTLNNLSNDDAWKFIDRQYMIPHYDSKRSAYPPSHNSDAHLIKVVDTVIKYNDAHVKERRPDNINVETNNELLIALNRSIIDLQVQLTSMGRTPPPQGEKPLGISDIIQQTAQTTPLTTADVQYPPSSSSQGTSIAEKLKKMREMRARNYE